MLIQQQLWRMETGDEDEDEDFFFKKKYQSNQQTKTSKTKRNKEIINNKTIKLQQYRYFVR
jgi:hypothetical protein